MLLELDFCSNCLAGGSGSELEGEFLAEEWMSTALAYPGVQMLELTPQIAIESIQLPGTFHRDLADQIIVATARIYDCLLLTVDDKSSITRM